MEARTHVTTSTTSTGPTTSAIHTQVGPTVTVDPNMAGPSGLKDHGFQQPRRRRRRPKQAQPSKGVVIGASRPKVHYIPKVNTTGKGKQVASTHDSSGTTDSSFPFAACSTGPILPETQSGTNAPPGPSSIPIPTPVINTSNRFDALCGINTNEVSIPSVSPPVGGGDDQGQSCYGYEEWCKRNPHITAAAIDSTEEEEAHSVRQNTSLPGRVGSTEVDEVGSDTGPTARFMTVDA